ncbi:hypothetical protein [Brucella intermedia]|uniref:hypothetical protein n=1 Tax=Brucella intermedia TaxID=94625 RepID=UPI00124ED144|nr:hypothetical protein [Brucella intermedia]KAB2709673.1 hypothetical protein F9K80_10400 [Brucella intermedia]
MPSKELTHEELKAIVAAKMADPNTTAADILSTIRAALQELDANQEQIGFREAFDSFQMLDGEPFLQTDVAQRVFSAVLAASALGEQSDGI